MQIRKVAKTVSLAIDEALNDLDTTIDNIDYEVLQEPSKGFLGLFSKPAKVLITLKKEDVPLDDIGILTSLIGEPSSYNEHDNLISSSKIEITPSKEEPLRQNTINEKYEIEEVSTIQVSTEKENKVPKMVLDEDEQGDFENIKPSYNPKSSKQSQSKLDRKTDKRLDKKEKQYDPNAVQVAEKFLKQIFEKMGVDIQINTQMSDKNHLLIDLKGENVGVVIGKRGQTLDSLQYLVNLVINRGTFAYMSVTIDTEDYRERRRLALENLAINLSKKAKKINKNVNLEPMNPYERRIIHSKLQGDKTVKTYSEGNEPFRYVVISPK